MAQLTVADLNDHVRDFIPGKTQAKIVRAANMVILKLHREVSQPLRGTFTTSPRVTTGTVNVTENSTTATFSSSLLTTNEALTLIQIEGDSSWFTLTGNGAGGVLSSVWAQATNTSATFTIIRPTISFGTSVGQIVKIWREGYEPLRYAPNEHVPQLLSTLTQGVPEYFTPLVFDTNRTPDDANRILLVPAPDVRYVFQFSYKVRPTLLTPTGSDTQKLTLPDLFNEAILAGTLFLSWDQEDKQDRSAYWKTRYQEALQDALKEANLPVATRFNDAYDENLWGLYEDRPIGG